MALAVAGGVLWWRARGDSEAAPKLSTASGPAAAARPGEPPGVDGAAERTRLRARARQPRPLPSHAIGAKVYAEAVAAGEKSPGEKAFRADADAFFAHNLDVAEERSTQEGLTMDEVKELNYLGLLAMHIRRWDEVSHVLGRELTAEQRARGDELVFSSSNDFKAAIRAHVEKGDSAEVRWETIRKLEAAFIDKYKALVGLSPEDFDRLLAVQFRTPGG